MCGQVSCEPLIPGMGSLSTRPNPLRLKAFSKACIGLISERTGVPVARESNHYMPQLGTGNRDGLPPDVGPYAALEGCT